MVLTLLKESLIFALHSLVANKLRSFLSLLGITIGIFAIILVFTIVDSLENNIRDSIKSLGNNVVYVQKWPWIFGPYPWWKYMNRPLPQYKELAELQKRTKSAEAMAFTVWGTKTLKYRSLSVRNAEFIGVSHDYWRIKTLNLKDGRYFTRNESDAGMPVVIVGAEIATGLFQNSDPIGQVISVSGHKTTIIGVLKKQGESLFETADYQVITPLNYARNILDIRSEGADPTIYVKARPLVTNTELIDDLTGAMRAIRKLKPRSEDNFALNESSLLSTGFDALFDVIGLAGWVIGGFSILVGGFGIANIMFVSVRERTSLIGIQKSLGARNLFILVQFLSESILLSLLGGLFGLLLTWAMTLLGSSMMDMEITLTGANVVLGITISVLIGIVSGFVPAYSASQLDPVEAIRSTGWKDLKFLQSSVCLASCPLLSLFRRYFRPPLKSWACLCQPYLGSW